MEKQEALAAALRLDEKWIEANVYEWARDSVRFQMSQLRASCSQVVDFTTRCV